MATDKMILNSMLLYHRTPPEPGRVFFAGSGPATGEEGVGSVCILRHHSEAGPTASANGTAGARRSSSVCSIHSGGEKTSDAPLPGLSAPFHKYGCIRAPLHPLPLRCAFSPYSTVCLSRAPRWRGASTLSVRHRIYEAEHLGRTGFTLLLLRPEQHVQDEKEDPDGDPDVGHVEGRPVIPVPVEVEEVHHVSEPGAVDEVPHRPSQDEPQAVRRGPPVRMEVEVGEHPPDGEHRGDDEQGVSPLRIEVGQQPERDPLVPAGDDVEEVDEDRPRIVEVEAGEG